MKISYFSVKAISIAFLAVFTFVGLSQHSQAADVEGRVVLNGQEVFLYDDGTWKYANVKSVRGKKCFSSAIIDGVGVCYKKSMIDAGSGDDWELLLSNKRSSFYAGWIAEGIPVESEALGDLIISNAGAAAEGGEDGVAVRSREATQVGGRPFMVMEYFANVDGIPVTYLNYYSPIDDKGSLQIVFFVGGSDIKPQQKKIDEFLAGMTFE